MVGWLASLALPALSFRFDGERDQILYGYQVLTGGYFHLLVLEFSWLANFAFWFLIWRLWKRPASTRVTSIATVVTLLLTAQSVEIFVLDRFFQYPRAYSGYYLWVGSNVLLCGAAFAAIFSANRRQGGHNSIIEKD